MEKAENCPMDLSSTQRNPSPLVDPIMSSTAPMTIDLAAEPNIQPSKPGLLPGSMEQPWLEKYRPMILGDVVGNQATIKRLKIIASDGNLPNIVIAGPPGTGKTTSIMCLARQLLGSSMKNAVLELNASDERGIDVVRNSIKQFAQQRVAGLPPNRHKIIILDEADSMTVGAQQALRRTMEIYSDTTRFALACNISSKIIEPIQSRCAIVRFNRLFDEEILTRLLSILQSEGVTTYTNDGLEAILFTAEGDMRNAINNLQSTYAGFGLVNADNVFKVCDQPHPKVLQYLLSQCQQAAVRQALMAFQGLWSQGYSAIDIVSTLFRVCKTADLEASLKLNFIREIGFVHLRIANGLDTNLQLCGLISKLCLLASGNSFD